MKLINAKIDSFNFASKKIDILFNSANYSIVPVKGIGVFEPRIWLETFGKPLTRNIVKAKIVHTNMGLTLPIKQFASNQNRYIVELAGLHSYTEHSKLLTQLLSELYADIQNEVITRIDIAIDFKEKVPKKIINALNKNRSSFIYINTCYLKTNKEGKTNSYINICIYPKHIKENLDFEIGRLEFSFRGSYLRGKYLVKDLDKLLKKIKKTIKKFTGLEVNIQSL